MSISEKNIREKQPTVPQGSRKQEEINCNITRGNNYTKVQ